MTAPARKLRSNFPRGSYLWAVRNAQWQAMGIPEEDCEKPKIAVVNSSSELAACYSHLDQVAKVVKEAIRAAGGVPFEIRTAAPSDFVTGAGARGAYMLAARDLVTNDIEVAVEGAQLDGMVCLTSCDKTVPGQLMAAARLNVPTIVAQSVLPPAAAGPQDAALDQRQLRQRLDQWRSPCRIILAAVFAEIGKAGREQARQGVVVELLWREVADTLVFDG